MSEDIDRESLFREANEVRALAMALQTVIEVNNLNSNKHPAWMLADMLVERASALEGRCSP